MSKTKPKTAATQETDAQSQSHDDTPLATALEEAAYDPVEKPGPSQQTEWQALTQNAAGIVRRNPLVSVGVAAVMGYLAGQVMRPWDDAANGDQASDGRHRKDGAVLGKINGPRTR